MCLDRKCQSTGIFPMESGVLVAAPDENYSGLAWYQAIFANIFCKNSENGYMFWV